MAQTTICLTKDDIETSLNGLHYQIKTTDGLVINFTPEAVEEFVKDVKIIKEGQFNG